jgi:hypothetical protein
VVDMVAIIKVAATSCELVVGNIISSETKTGASNVGGSAKLCITRNIIF